MFIFGMINTHKICGWNMVIIFIYCIKLIIMKKLFILLLAASPLLSIAQAPHKHDLHKTPIADETEVSETKSKYKVMTCSDEVYLKVMSQFRDSVTTVIMKPNKKDRLGTYTEYIVYFPKEYRETVEKFIKNL